MTEPITFGQMCRVLDELGFRRTAGPKGHTILRHESSGTVLYYPPHQLNDRMPASYMVGTRKLLIDHGVVSAEQLEQLLHPVAA